MHNYLCVLPCLALSFVLGDAIQYAPVVRVRRGRVRGVVETVDHGKSVYLYQGIPYGQAKRFAKANYPSPWAGVLNATSYREACPQMDLEKAPFGVATQTQSMSEECLYLNVWRPRTDFVADVMLGGMIIPMRRVLVFFLGSDGYEKGTIFTQVADAKHLVSQGDIVVVTVQYRLGPFGFLYGGTKDAPGNVGLHDQILALRWIYYNIARFSGDHNHVTIAGQSSGAISVGSLILSPLNFRLFRRAILQSGSPLSAYGPTSKEEALNRTIDFAGKLNCPSDINGTLDCLRNKTTAELLKASSDSFAKNRLFLPIYGDDLLPLKPSRALKEGKFNLNYDLLFGTTKDEGADYVSLFVPEGTNLTLESARESLKWMMRFYGRTDGDEVAAFYTEHLNETATHSELKEMIAQAWADWTIVCPTILFAETYAKKATGRFYYSYRLDQPFSYPVYFSSPNVQHGQDLMYLFAGPSDKRFTQGDMKLSKDMLQAWTSFTKGGWIRGWYGKIAWGRAFEKPTEPATKFMSLNHSAGGYNMISGFYNETCNGFWRERLFEEEKL